MSQLENWHKQRYRKGAVARTPSEAADGIAAPLPMEGELASLLRQQTTGFEPFAASLSRALWLRDPDTAAHCQRVANYALRLCDALGLGAEERGTIGLGALLHDLGKIGIPDSILFKPSPLDGEEWSQIRAHSAYGRRIVEFLPGTDAIWPLIYAHHERLDGQGYPQGLQGDELSLGMRIVTLTDAIDAMLSRRPYHEPLSRDQVIGELYRNAGSQFDAGLVRVAVALLDAVPPGACRDAS